MAPPIPAGAPEAAAPAISAVRVAESITVEAGVIEIVQAVEVVGHKLVVRRLIVDELVVDGLIVDQLSARIQLIGGAGLGMRSDGAVSSRNACAGCEAPGVAVAGESAAAE